MHWLEINLGRESSFEMRSERKVQFFTAINLLPLGGRGYEGEETKDFSHEKKRTIIFAKQSEERVRSRKEKNEPRKSSNFASAASHPLWMSTRQLEPGCQLGPKRALHTKTRAAASCHLPSDQAFLPLQHVRARLLGFTTRTLYCCVS